MLQLFFVAIVLVFAAIGAYGVISYRRGLARFAAASAGWRKTEATVTSSRLQDIEVTDSDNDVVGTNYRPEISYSYEVEGTQRQGGSVYLCRSSDFSSFDRAQQWLQRHAPGTTVPLWYDPANPQDAALELNKPSMLAAIAMVVVGLGGAAFFAYMLVSIV